MKKILLKRIVPVISAVTILFATGCGTSQIPADAVFFNGIIYTVDSAFTVATAFVVADGKIIATGSDQEMLQYNARVKTDLKRKFVYPGFQDAHCHFYGYGNDLKKIWLIGTHSFEAIIDTLKKYENQKVGDWIFGRGWDQNDWAKKNYPNKDKLDILFPDIPVFLLRVDGHAAIVNQKALDLAGITNVTSVTGGLIEKKNNKLTGLLIDGAVDLVYRVIPASSRMEIEAALLGAQKHCFESGLTSVTDAGIQNTGLKLHIISIIDSLQKSNKLLMRVNAMGALEELDKYKSSGKIKTGSLNVRSFKLYCDGALGSRGACLLQPYSDQPGHFGFMIHPYEYLDSIAKIVASIGFQLNSHCIGDSAHRVMLGIYESHISGVKDHRWRIEHAQVINAADLSYYKRNNIIPSMQPVHATSDMYWAEDRLGPDRVKGAYALRDLMNQNNLIAAGSDFPVENINPLFGFYAAVSRKDQKGFPAKGFQKENGISREQALRAMTIWAAFAAFTEKETGSLEKGKSADFVILEDDLMKVDEEKLWQLKVKETYISGNRVFQRPE